jgi:hypothetical protein
VTNSSAFSASRALKGEAMISQGCERVAGYQAYRDADQRPDNPLDKIQPVRDCRHPARDQLAQVAEAKPDQ